MAVGGLGLNSYCKNGRMNTLFLFLFFFKVTVAPQVSHLSFFSCSVVSVKSLTYSFRLQLLQVIREFYKQSQTDCYVMLLLHRSGMGNGNLEHKINWCFLQLWQRVKNCLVSLWHLYKEIWQLVCSLFSSQTRPELWFQPGQWWEGRRRNYSKAKDWRGFTGAEGEARGEA